MPDVAVRTLAQLAALRTGQVLAISDLARDAKLNAATAVLAYNGREAVRLDDRLWALPIGRLVE